MGSKLKFTVSVARTRYNAIVEKKEQSEPDEEGYFSTTWGITFDSEDGNCHCYTVLTTQYDLEPALVDVVTCISNEFNYLFLSFAKYGQKVEMEE